MEQEERYKQLEDTLVNSLRFLQKKHPGVRIEVNNEVLRPHHIQLQDSTIPELQTQLQRNAPSLLERTVHTLESEHSGEIFVLDVAEDEHVFSYHF